jgi:hypothetical protein
LEASKFGDYLNINLGKEEMPSASDNHEECLQLGGSADHLDEDFIFYDQIYNILSRNEYPQNLEQLSFISLQKEASEYCVSKTFTGLYENAMKQICMEKMIHC